MTLQRGDVVIHRKTKRTGVVLSTGKVYTYVRLDTSGRRKVSRVFTVKLKQIG